MHTTSTITTTTAAITTKISHTLATRQYSYMYSLARVWTSHQRVDPRSDARLAQYRDVKIKRHVPGNVDRKACYTLDNAARNSNSNNSMHYQDDERELIATTMITTTTASSAKTCTQIVVAVVTL